MAEPDLFPRTPETSPNVTPNVTPSLLRRNIIRPSPLVNDITTPVTEPSENPLINQILEGIEPENLPITPPPPYPGLANHAETSRQNSVFEDYPPPGYDTCTDSDDNDEPVPGRVVHTTSITSVTSVTSDTALLSAEPGCSNTSDVGSSVRTGPCDCGGEESSTNGHGCSDDSENGSCVQSDCCGRSGAEPHILPQKTWGYESGTSHDLESNDPEQSEMLTDILSSLTPDIQRSFKRLDSSLKMKNSCRRRKNSRQDYENSRQEQANGRITESHSSSNISRTGANIAIQRQYSDGALWERYVRSPAVGRGSSALSRRKNKNGDLSSGSNKKHRHSPTQRQQVAPAIIVNSPSNTVVGPPSSISPAARSETDIFNLSRHAQYSSLPHKQFPNSSGAQRPDSNGGFNLSRQNSYTSRIETNPFELNSRSALNNPEVSVIGISDSQSLNASLNISLDDLDSSNV